MLYIETDSKDAAFHFSVEEYFLQAKANEPVMMIWQTDKCVMLGNYQVADAEIDIRYAEKEGIQVVRRSSGGGTIFTDLGTLLYTIIQPYGNDDYAQRIARDTVAGPVADALNKMGIPACLEGRNDILVDGKKVSGFAQYARRGWLCSHGSLLYDADLESLAKVLRVDDEKIRSKAIRSVRSRVTNIREYMAYDCTTQEFWDSFKQKLFEVRDVREHILTAPELEEIDKIYNKKYGNPAWTFDSSPEFTYHNSQRFPEGKAEVFLDIKKGIVSACSIRGDFLGTVPIRGLEEQLENKPFQYQVLSDVLDSVPLAPYLGGITREQLLSCMFE